VIRREHPKAASTRLRAEMGGEGGRGSLRGRRGTIDGVKEDAS
jgi:hypothetical protein